MKKLIITFWLFSLLITCFPFQTVLAGDTNTSGLEMGTLIPQAKQETMLCKDLLVDIEESEDPVKYFKESSQEERDEILACGVMTGKIHFWMIPYYIVYWIEFLIGIAGLIAILFLVIGGFQYVASGLSTNKDRAKGTIKNALIGLGVVLAAWAVVNVVQYIVTL